MRSLSNASALIQSKHCDRGWEFSVPDVQHDAFFKHKSQIRISHICTVTFFIRLLALFYTCIVSILYV